MFISGSKAVLHKSFQVLHVRGKGTWMNPSHIVYLYNPVASSTLREYSRFYPIIIVT